MRSVSIVLSTDPPDRRLCGGWRSLVRIYRGGRQLKDSELRNCIALAQTRNLDQDPMFTFRIIVDIAAKALSPAVNDPTTAVLAIDHLHYLLRDVGGRNLADGFASDQTGRVLLTNKAARLHDLYDRAGLARTEKKSNTRRWNSNPH